MAKNTGRCSSTSIREHRATVHGGEWVDTIARGWEVWSEEDGVAVYEGPKETATRRTLLCPADARRLADMLYVAARDASKLAR